MRQARTRDIPQIRGLIDQNTGSRRLLDKTTVNLYESVLEFTVAESATDGAVAGCGALHVIWEDLAELRTVAVDERRRGSGIGHLIVDELLDRARAVGVSRVFVLTFAVPIFARHGFTEIFGTPVAPEVYAELLRSYDEGVAEFLELDRVKPNTLGNTRMLLRLLAVPVRGPLPSELPPDGGYSAGHGAGSRRAGPVGDRGRRGPRRRLDAGTPGAGAETPRACAVSGRAGAAAGGRARR